MRCTVRADANKFQSDKWIMKAPVWCSLCCFLACMEITTRTWMMLQYRCFGWVVDTLDESWIHQCMRTTTRKCAWWKGKDENFTPSIGKEENCARDARHGEKERKKISGGEKESWARALTAFWAGLADCLLGNPTDAGGVNGNSYLRSNPACASFPWSSRHTQIRPQFLNGGSTS